MRTTRLNAGPTGTLCAALVAASLGTACSDSGQSVTADTPGQRVAITVAPLDLPGVGDVSYQLTVFNGLSPTPDTVFDVTISASRFGDGRGSASYVGPCDAAANPNTVRLELLEMRDTAGEVISPETWVNPTPVSMQVTCLENADAPVNFNLVVMRDAQQGFFDMAVELDTIFCSAKLDCVGDDGAPINLLHNQEGQRDTTLVVAWACTAGQDKDTWLYMDPVVVTCSDGTQLTLPPGGPEGNRPGLEPYFFRSARYHGRESLPGYNKCYSNTAIGVSLEALPADLGCTVTASATASSAAWDGGASPAGTVYPYVHWEVPIIADGQLSCTQHPINTAGSGVETRYTTVAGGRHFAWSYECAPDGDATVNGLVCGSQVGEGEAIKFISVSSDEIAMIVGDEQAAPQRLPEGLRLSESCCQDLCCQP